MVQGVYQVFSNTLLPTSDKKRLTEGNLMCMCNFTFTLLLLKLTSVFDFKYHCKCIPQLMCFLKLIKGKRFALRLEKKED